MLENALAPVASLLLSLTLLPLARRQGIKHGFCDQPGEDELKIHGRPISYLGGVAMFAAFFAGLAAGSLVLGGEGSWSAVVGGGFLAMTLGLWDDVKWKGGTTYRPSVKFAVQVSVSLAVAVGVALVGLRVLVLPHVVPGLLLSALYIFGGMNAVNMQDGIDGLAGSLVGISLGGFAALSALSGTGLGMTIPLALLGAVIGFLVFNTPPASVFMGDNGSHMLGAVLGILAISFTSRAYDLRWFVAPILVIGLPVFDAALAVARRAWRGKPLFQGDRGHLYDWLIRRGLGVGTCLLVCCTIQAVLVGCGLLVALL